MSDIEHITIDTERQLLTLRMDDGACLDLGHAQLRRACRCAWCESGRRLGNPPQAAQDTAITGWEPMGAALNLRFSDGHDRGIYPFAYLLELAGRLSGDAGGPTRSSS